VTDSPDQTQQDTEAAAMTLDEAVASLRIRPGALTKREEEALYTVLAALDSAQERVTELEAEFTGHIEWTIGALDEDGKPYYLGSYTEAGARHHAAQRTRPHFPAWRRRTNWHHADASTSHAADPTAAGDPA